MLCRFWLIGTSGSLYSCKRCLIPVASFHAHAFDRLVVIPLSFLRRLDSLKYTSVVALVSIGYLVILIVYHFSKGDTMEDRGPIRIVESGGLIQVLQSFPVIVFAYTCHQNVSLREYFRRHSPNTARCSPY